MHDGDETPGVTTVPIGPFDRIDTLVRRQRRRLHRAGGVELHGPGAEDARHRARHPDEPEVHRAGLPPARPRRPRPRRADPAGSAHRRARARCSSSPPRRFSAPTSSTRSAGRWPRSPSTPCTSARGWTAPARRRRTSASRSTTPRAGRRTPLAREELLKRVAPYGRVVFLGGDVHFACSLTHGLLPKGRRDAVAHRPAHSSPGAQPVQARGQAAAAAERVPADGRDRLRRAAAGLDRTVAHRAACRTRSSRRVGAAGSSARPRSCPPTAGRTARRCRRAVPAGLELAVAAGARRASGRARCRRRCGSRCWSRPRSWSSRLPPTRTPRSAPTATVAAPAPADGERAVRVPAADGLPDQHRARSGWAGTATASCSCATRCSPRPDPARSRAPTGRCTTSRSRRARSAAGADAAVPGRGRRLMPPDSAEEAAQHLVAHRSRDQGAVRVDPRAPRRPRARARRSAGTSASSPARRSRRTRPRSSASSRPASTPTRSRSPRPWPRSATSRPRSRC